MRTTNIQPNFDLSKHNTMALSCTASHAIILDDENQVPDTFAKLANRQDIRPFILSGGSNVILPSMLNALAILPRYTGITTLAESDENIDIEVMGGNNWHELVVDLTNKGWYGLENLALIPGLVGASPVQNIGAYGVQLEDCLTHVKAFHIPTQTWQTMHKQDCQFAYRDSVFKQNPNTWLITRVGFRLHKNARKINANYGDVAIEANKLAKANGRSTATAIDVMDAIIHIRKSKLPDPAILANTGSFFQNPIIARQQYDDLLKQFPDMPKYDIDEASVKVPAGWLIDQAGLKGGGIAPILTHEKQALVLTNHAPFKATQTDIAKTRDMIIDTVKQRYGIGLHPEPVWVD